ncbi:MAG: hypothetical protein MJ252_23635, partial [archaeon]|nr:hypothetical protein [archaeon]
MSKNLSFFKEFENYVLGTPMKDCLQNLVPGTDQYYFLNISEELKKCQKEKAISPELEKLLKNFKEDVEKRRGNRASLELFKEFDFRKTLIEFDDPKTTEERKAEILSALEEEFSGKQYDFDKPYFAKKMNEEGE